MKPKAAQIHKLLTEKDKTIATAESCTGGLLAKSLTDLAGSSKYFILGVITYSNESKNKILKIPASIISEKGAVSAEVANLMSKNIRNIAKTDFGIGITGIAGPHGASKQKPVGTVYISLNSSKIKLCKKFVFKGSRINIRKMAAFKALDLLKTLL